jgi:hypothetical protein
LLNHGLSFSRINIVFPDGIHALEIWRKMFKPTRISGNTSTLLDPIILSDTLNCNYSDVLKIPRHVDVNEKFENSSHISSTSSKLQSFSFQFISVSI